MHQGLRLHRRSENAEEPGNFEIREGMHLRMNGPKKLMSEIKAHEGSMIEIVGLMKKGQYNDGVNIGGGVGSGPGRRGLPAAPEPRGQSDPDRRRRLASDRRRLSLAIVRAARADAFRCCAPDVTWLPIAATTTSPSAGESHRNVDHGQPPPM